ncbi:MAG: polyprenyl synthetase family protein [Anaerolineales bacterium]
MTDPEELRSIMLAKIEGELLDSATAIRQGPAVGMYELIAHHMGWDQGKASGGKRIRPLLTLLCCAAAGGEWQLALPAAAAVEWLHNFSLIHDDIEDQSSTRRGRETLWAKAGTALAINTGDALFALSRLSIQDVHDGAIRSDRALKMLHLLDRTALSLCEGQHLDMRFESENEVTPAEYMVMIGGKTSALIACACEMGAMLSPASDSQQACYREFGRNLGLAFQMQDDILGIWGEPEKTGKPSGDDLRIHKKTLPVILGLERSATFRAAWQKPPGHFDLKELISALEEAGIQQMVQSMADEYSRTALLALEDASPEAPAENLLRNLLGSLLRREN